MIREVHPNEVLVSVCIFAVLAVVLFGAGYWLGHRGIDQLRRDYDIVREGQHELFVTAVANGWLDDDDPIRINVECSKGASDWPAIRMANEIAAKYDIPAFVHGNCQTHSVVDVKPAPMRWCLISSACKPAIVDCQHCFDDRCPKDEAGNFRIDRQLVGSLAGPVDCDHREALPEDR